jgi:hypothetical protein
MRNRPLPAPSLLASLAVCAGALLVSLPASAQSVIKRPGAHPDYVFEAEPHLAFGFFLGPGDDLDEGFGPGFRGTIELVDNGFIKTINNTVGIGFGLDWLFYGDHCHRRRGGRCFNDDHDHDRILVPVVMQWNFWLSESWSVFGEPGFALDFYDDHDRDDLDYEDDDKDLRFRPFIFFAGGRFHFNDKISLTMRVGYPYFSVGVSFFL